MFRAAGQPSRLDGGSEREYWVAPNHNNGWLCVGILVALKESNIHEEPKSEYEYYPSRISNDSPATCDPGRKLNMLIHFIRGAPLKYLRYISQWSVSMRSGSCELTPLAQHSPWNTRRASFHEAIGRVDALVNDTSESSYCV